METLIYNLVRRSSSLDLSPPSAALFADKISRIWRLAEGWEKNCKELYQALALKHQYTGKFGF